MAGSDGRPPIVMFDESHAETWSIDPLIAFANSATTPEYFSYDHLAGLLRTGLGYEVRRNTTTPVSGEVLAEVAVMVIVHPADPSVHEGVGGEPIFTVAEIQAIVDYVIDGGALFVLNEHTANLWKSNINDLLDRFSLRFNDDVASVVLESPSGTYSATSFSTDYIIAHPITEGVKRISILAGCTIGTHPGSLVESVAFATEKSQPIVAASGFGKGRIVVMGDSDVFALPYIRQHDNLRLFLNIMQWLATSRVHHSPPVVTNDMLQVQRPSIFLSYARVDYIEVKKLYDSLKIIGFDVWLDKESLLPGQRFEDVINRAISKCDFFIPCFSPNSLNRRGLLQRELRLALDAADNYLDGDIYIVPVRLAPCSIENRFAHYQWVDLFLEDGLPRLVSALQYGVQQRLGIS